jgi:hypothetical protein
MSNVNKNISESSLTRVWKHTQKHEAGIITAFRSKEGCGTKKDKPINTSQNLARNAKLKAKLMQLGYGVTEVDGSYFEKYKTDQQVEVKEKSFLVIDLNDSGNLKSDLMKLGEYFMQDSIIFGKPNGDYYLISTNECPLGYPGRGKIGVEEKQGKALFGKDGEFFSRVKGRPFVFTKVDPDLEEITNYYPTEIRSIKALAECVKI